MKLRPSLAFNFGLVKQIVPKKKYKKKNQLTSYYTNKFV